MAVKDPSSVTIEPPTVSRCTIGKWEEIYVTGEGGATAEHKMSEARGSM